MSNGTKAKKLPGAIQAADNQVPGFTSAVVQWLRGSSENAIAMLNSALTLEGFIALVESGGLVNILRRETQVGAYSLQMAFLNVIREGARVGIAQVQERQARKAEGLFSISFDLINPRAIEFIRNYMFALVVGVDTQVRENLRSELLRSFQGLQSVRSTSQQIREFIGLTPQQLTAVNNYRKMLESGKYREAMQNVLRDAHYDASLIRLMEEKGKLSQEKIDQMVSRYTQRYLNHRAKTIARTETIRAARFGQQEAWRQMVDQGVLTEPRQEWLSENDERSCKFCPQIPALNPQGVRLDGMFRTPNGFIDGPPAHTTCRCFIGLLFPGEESLQ